MQLLPMVLIHLVERDEEICFNHIKHIWAKEMKKDMFHSEYTKSVVINMPLQNVFFFSHNTLEIAIIESYIYI